MSKIAPRPSAGLAVLGPFTLTPTGLVAAGVPTFPQWKEAGTQIRRFEGAVAWWVGDWLNYGERRWGEKYEEAAAATGLENGTLRQCKWVAGAVDLSRRRDKLSFAHHQEIASLDPVAGDALLDEAEREGWNVKQLREKVAESKKRRGETEVMADLCRWLKEAFRRSKTPYRISPLDTGYLAVAAHPPDGELWMLHLHPADVRKWYAAVLRRVKEHHGAPQHEHVLPAREGLEGVA